MLDRHINPSNADLSFQIYFGNKFFQNILSLPRDKLGSIEKPALPYYTLIFKKQSLKPSCNFKSFFNFQTNFPDFYEF